MSKIKNQKERFYVLTVNINLFNEFVLERIYGNINNKAPTGRKSMHLTNMDDAIYILKNIIHIKQKKEYKIDYTKCFLDNNKELIEHIIR